MVQDALEALVQRPGGVPEARNWKEGGYLSRLPTDPWGNPYQYLSPGRNGDFDVYTLGKDGQPQPPWFGPDGLHMSRRGYALWVERLTPWVEAHGKPATHD